MQMYCFLRLKANSIKFFLKKISIFIKKPPILRLLSGIITLFKRIGKVVETSQKSCGSSGEVRNYAQIDEETILIVLYMATKIFVDL